MAQDPVDVPIRPSPVVTNEALDHHLSTAIARLKRHRAWAERTLRWAHSQEKDFPGVVEHCQHTIDIAAGVFQRVVMRAADIEAKQTKN